MQIYPSYSDYNLAVATLATSARHPLLKQAKPLKVGNDRLLAYTGGYARVYPVRCNGRTFALRCLTADVPGLRARYRTAAEYLKHQKPTCIVDFEYLDDSIFVKGQNYPVVWMGWVEGQPLREFVGQSIGNSAVIRGLATRFSEMVTDLHAHGIAHGDLQDENILVETSGTSEILRLVDYDSLFVPGLYGASDTIFGIPTYQHPRRPAAVIPSSNVDYFSELVIYLSLLAYAENPALWEPNVEKRLLFKDTDFADPVRSPVFQALSKMPREIPALADVLSQFCREPDPLRLRPLEFVIEEISRMSYGSSRRSVGGSRSLSTVTQGLGGTINKPLPVSNRVFVVHGRHQRVRDDLFNLLRAAGLHPIEWTEAISETGHAAPYTGQVLEAAFVDAQAVVVLLTPDDEVRLRDDLVLPKDGIHEREMRRQARPNVLFEAGMAFGSHPDRTILVQVGDVKPFSDVAGRHVVHLADDVASRHDLLIRLKKAGCPVDLDRGDWMRVGKFSFED
jgi:hypothetical protein